MCLSAGSVEAQGLKQTRAEMRMRTVCGALEGGTVF